MKLEHSDIDALSPLIERIVSQTVTETLAALDHGVPPTLGGKRISYGEVEAAALIGAKPHRLRDARRRGEIKFSKLGKAVLYRHDDLVQFVEENSIANPSWEK